MTRDAEYLNVLAVCHYAVAGLSALCGLFPVLHLFLGVALVRGDFEQGMPVGPGGPPPAFASVGWGFILVASFIILTMWTYAGCLALAGRFLQRRRHYMFCMVMAVISCLNVPLGTVLGIFTIVVLSRSGVQKMFQRRVARKRRAARKYWEEEDEEDEEI
jgi:hypothetical protein